MVGTLSGGTAIATATFRPDRDTGLWSVLSRHITGSHTVTDTRTRSHNIRNGLLVWSSKHVFDYTSSRSCCMKLDSLNFSSYLYIPHPNTNRFYLHLNKIN